jgi:hypothetical protein
VSVPARSVVLCPQSHCSPIPTAWHPEYGRWMVEATPGRPYADSTSDLLAVEVSMVTRRMRMRKALPPGTVPMSITHFFAMGRSPSEPFTTPPLPPGGKFARSPFIPDEAISPHPRFGTLTANIRRRRGEHVCAMVPVLAGVTPNRVAMEAVSAGLEAIRERRREFEPLVDRGELEDGMDAESLVPTDSKATASASAASTGHGAVAAHDSSSEAADRSLLARDMHGVWSSAEASVERECPPDILPGTPQRPVDLPSPWTPDDTHIHLDAMAFGMGCCCLQVTFQAKDLEQSRRLYDSLAVLAPLMLALSAATPIFRGRLADTDTRWGVICDSVDCRTPQERGVSGCGMGCLRGSASVGTIAHDKVATAIRVAAALTAEAEAADRASTRVGRAGCVTTPSDRWRADIVSPEMESLLLEGAPPPGGVMDPSDPTGGCPPGEPSPCGCGEEEPHRPRWMSHPLASEAAGHGERPLAKSRYSSVDCFIGRRELVPAELSDLPLAKDEEAEKRMIDAGVDEALAAHVASLFVRDPLVVFSERVAEVDDASEPDHWENLQSTNWRSMRWKPPPPDNDSIGWRIELRTMEAQCTDFANAALTVTSALFSRVLLFFDLNILVPISLVDANMVTARRRGAARFGRFFFRKGATVFPTATVPSDDAHGVTAGVAWELLSLDTILMGDHSHKAATLSREEPWPGLIPLCFAYLDLIGCDGAARERVDGYLRFVAGRARGEIPTDAQWIRHFVATHPDYKGDDVVPDTVVHDLIAAIDAIQSSVSEPSGSAELVMAGVSLDTEALVRDLLGPVGAAARVSGEVAAMALSGVKAGKDLASRLADTTAHSAVRAALAEMDASAKRLRGASFVEEVKSATQCAQVRALVTRHTVNAQKARTFATTPSFLPSISPP